MPQLKQQTITIRYSADYADYEAGQSFANAHVVVVGEAVILPERGSLAVSVTFDRRLPVGDLDRLKTRVEADLIYALTDDVEGTSTPILPRHLNPVLESVTVRATP